MGLDWEARGVLADFRRCQIAAQNTDLVFHCTNGHVSAHQMIFAGISPLFTDLMQRYVVGQELIPLDLNISLPEIRREHMEMVVEMVYLGQVRMTKRDYQPFREICQLLALCVPIADYDNFFMNQTNRARSNSILTQNNQVQVSLPVTSWSSSRFFVCSECFALFQSKLALSWHKSRKHGQTESQDSEPSPSPIIPESSTPTQLNTRPSRQRSLRSSKRIMEDGDNIDTGDNNDVEAEVQNILEDESEVLGSSALPIVSEPSTVTKFNTELSRRRSLEARKQILENEDSIYTEDNDIETEVENALEHASQTSDPSQSPIIPESAPPTQLKPRSSLTRSSKTRKRILENEERTDTEDNDVETEVENKNALEHESQTSNPSPSPIIPKSAPPTRLKTRLSEKRSSKRSKILVCPPVIECKVECPDCQRLFPPDQVRYHLTLHLRDELDKLAAKSISNSGLFECEFCPFKTAVRFYIRKHLALTHDLMKKFANEAQMKFLDDAKKVNSKVKCSSHKKKVVPKMKTKINIPKTRKGILEKDDIPEMEAKGVETEVEKLLNNGSLTSPMISKPSRVTKLKIRPRRQRFSNKSRPKEDRIFKCPDCQNLFARKEVRSHLALHLRDQLNVLAAKCEIGSGFFNCELCSYDTTFYSNIRNHLALAHNMITKFANETQMKFLDEAQNICL